MHLQDQDGYEYNCVWICDKIWCIKASIQGSGVNQWPCDSRSGYCYRAIRNHQQNRPIIGFISSYKRSEDGAGSGVPAKSEALQLKLDKVDTIGLDLKFDWWYKLSTKAVSYKSSTWWKTAKAKILDVIQREQDNPKMEWFSWENQSY